LRELGYEVITVTKKDIFPDADEVVEQIRLQLIRKGWRP
jgi:very-short-patch-repair endonuclease